MDVETTTSPLLFNFGTIKRISKPGSWRRGYGYFREGNVQSVSLSEGGVQGSVKGKFKEGYQVHLYFDRDHVSATCDCPLEEEWCKHAIAVALKSVEEQLWEKYWKLPLEDESSEQMDFEGNYQFILNTKRTPKHVSIRIVERNSAEALKQLEPVLKAAIVIQTSGEQPFSEAEKREFSLMQFLLKTARPPKSEGQGRSDGWFDIPWAETSKLLGFLSQLEEVCFPNGDRILFESDPLRLVMSLNVSMAGNVLVSLHWVRKSPEDVYPIEELTLINREIPWGIYKNHVFPLSTTLNKLPGYMTKSSFTDIRDADGGKFMYEELPKIRKVVEIDEADIIEQLRLERRPPHKILQLEKVDDASLRLRASLSFSYDDVEVPYSKSAPETPYVMVVKKQTETIYWIKREMKAEQAAHELLSQGGLEPIQSNIFSAEGDDAIDFYNLTLPKLGEDWTVKGNDAKLDLFKVSPYPLKIRAHIDFSDSVDSFVLEISCVIGEQFLDLDEVQHHLLQGKKYFLLDGAGFVEVPLAAILQFGRTLQGFDAETIGQDLYKIQTFKAGLIAELVDQGVELNFSPKFQEFWNVISSFTSMKELPVPDKVNATLRPYQVRGFNWLYFLYSYGLNGILADDMGLGKTLQALTLLQQAKDQDGTKPALIVCPTSVVFNWEKEASRFTPDLKLINLTGPNRHGLYKQIKQADIVLTSYALLRRDISALKNYEFRHVILDESQNIKNYDSQTAQASKQLQSNHRLAMSGTPIENRLSELWSVFDFLMPGFLYEVDTFRQKFVVPIEDKGNRDAERRLKKQVFPFILRRMKRDVARDLPPKVEQVSYCEMTDAQRELYLDILDQTRDQVFSQVAEKGIEGSQASIFTALLRLRQVCCHPKLVGPDLSQGVNESGKFEALQEMLEEIISEGHRILLFSQFVEMLKIVRHWLDKKGIRYEYLTGETKERDRGASVDRFNNDDSIPIFLISLKAGGTGLNLTGADYVIHYDPWWNPAAEDQATDRAHRIGQTKTVFVYRMITRGTVEEKIVKLQDRKRDLVDSIIAADRAMGKLLSFEDLKDILSPSF